MIPVIVIQGATAVGKSSFAMKLAEELSTQIISADSRQVYKLMNIGTAKPSRQEQKKINHHLIDIINPDAEYSAGDFARDAEKLIEKIYSKGKIPIVCGGTGFYVKALLEGIFQAPVVPAEIRRKLKKTTDEKGSKFLHDKLAEIDPDSAERADPNDSNRIIRALEIYEYTGKTITQLWLENPPAKKNMKPFKILIERDRNELYDRINLRVEKMLENGLLEEIKNLLQLGFAPDIPGFNTVGYKELIPYFLAGAELEECIKLIKQHTRNYAKRQLTWYRKQDFDLTLTASDIIISKVKNKINKYFK